MTYGTKNHISIFIKVCLKISQKNPVMSKLFRNKRNIINFSRATKSNMFLVYLTFTKHALLWWCYTKYWMYSYITMCTTFILSIFNSIVDGFKRWLFVCINLYNKFKFVIEKDLCNRWWTVADCAKTVQARRWNVLSSC